MSIALSVIGIVVDAKEPILCYSLLRVVRGSGAFPDPNLPSDVEINGVYHTPVPGSPIKLLTWERVLTYDEENLVRREISQGCISIPVDCPIAGGEIITGVPFGPLIVSEGSQRRTITGAGLLYREGIASDIVFNSVVTTLNESLKQGTAPKVLRSLIQKIGELLGEDQPLKYRIPIGAVDFFYRGSFKEGVDGPLFEIIAVKPNFRSRDPMVQLRICRDKAEENLEYMLHVTLSNYDDVVKSTLFNVDVHEKEVSVISPTHITDVTVRVFDNAGNLVDQITNKFVQQIGFGLSAIGAVDILPSPFRGSPKTPDLDLRARIVTSTFEGASIANRSGGLDVLRLQAISINTLIGKQSGNSEDIWFERGLDSQVDVIRWIKKKIEQPGVSKVYLVDPYLGSDAFKRVVVRQGNQSAALYIIVSPGRVDPDAETTNTTDVNYYLEKLKSTAADLAEMLAGDVTVFHIKRGDGSRQAFHDRYICMVDDKGVPTVYLLSNSLSKAAGDWPFAISALDQVTCWRVYAYIFDLIHGDPKVTKLHPEVIWSSSDAKLAQSEHEPSPSDEAPHWVVQANAFLSDVRNIIIQNSKYAELLDARINLFLSYLPEGLDLDKLAEALFKASWHREAIVIFISKRFRGAELIKVADILDESLLAQFIDKLPTPDHKNISCIPLESRRTVFKNLSETIVRKPRATNFVRGSLNPKMHQLVCLIETQRHAFTWEAHEACLILSIIALEVAAHLEAGPISFRVGLATDYIHWIGRLMRSDTAATKYGSGNILVEEWEHDLTYAAQKLVHVNRVLGGALDPAIARVNDDPWVTPVFKNAIANSFAEVF